MNLPLCSNKYLKTMAWRFLDALKGMPSCESSSDRSDLLGSLYSCGYPALSQTAIPKEYLYLGRLLVLPSLPAQWRCMADIARYRALLYDIASPCFEALSVRLGARLSKALPTDFFSASSALKSQPSGHNHLHCALLSLCITLVFWSTLYTACYKDLCGVLR
jgi:hypothetical protein